MNPFIKNCKTGFHNDLLNRTSHYCKLLLSRTTIDNRQNNQHAYLLQQKGQRQIDQRRNKINQDLMKSLIDIDRKNGTYRAFSEQMSPRKKTLKNKYVERQKNVALSEDNIRLYRKILTTDTDFSPQKIKKFDQQITKYSKLIRHPFQEICQMDKEFYKTYRHQLLKGQLSPTRQNTVDLSSKVQDSNRPRRRKNRKLKKLKRSIIVERTIEDNPE